MVRRALFAGAIVGVLALMGYGVYEAFAGTATHAAGAPDGWAAEGGTVPMRQGRAQGQGVGRAVVADGLSAGPAGGLGLRSGAAPSVPSGSEDEAWAEVSGRVVSIDGNELMVKTAQGESLTAELGRPSYWESLGLLLAGDEVQLSGFWEDAEFEVQSLTRVATGTTVVLRDQTGRPLWAGDGRWASTTATGSRRSFWGKAN